MLDNHQFRKEQKELKMNETLEVIKSFWHKHWWSFVYYFILIFFVIFPLIGSIGTWERWKWGYYSLDAIAPIVFFFLLEYCDNIQIHKNLLKRIEDLENQIKFK